MLLRSELPKDSPLAAIHRSLRAHTICFSVMRNRCNWLAPQESKPKNQVALFRQTNVRLWRRTDRVRNYFFVDSQAQSMKAAVRDLYKRFLVVGKDYPKGLSYVREKAKQAFIANRNLQKDEEINRAVAKGRYMVKELIGVI